MPAMLALRLPHACEVLIVTQAQRVEAKVADAALGGAHSHADVVGDALLCPLDGAQRRSERLLKLLQLRGASREVEADGRQLGDKQRCTLDRVGHGHATVRHGIGAGGGREREHFLAVSGWQDWDVSWY